METRLVRISVFQSDDPRTVPQRLEQAVAAYCAALNIPVPPPDSLVTARTEKGKPYFPLAEGFCLSISHSGRYWACAIGEQPVGLDLQEPELPRREETTEEMLRRHQKMAHRFFHPREAEFVDRDPRYNFLTVWTAREAYVKYTGQGIDKHFSEHCVIPDSEADLQRISGEVQDVRWSAMGREFWKTYFRDYTICVCTEFPCEYAVTTE